MHLVATVLETNSSTHHCFISLWESLTHLVFDFKYAVIKLRVKLLSPYQTHFFFHSLSLAQLPLTAAFTSSRSPALHCHSSSVSFSSPLPHGTTSVWKVLCMPCWRGFRQMVQWESWEQRYLFVSGVTLHANQHRPCPELGSQYLKSCVEVPPVPQLIFLQLIYMANVTHSFWQKYISYNDINGVLDPPR